MMTHQQMENYELDLRGTAKVTSAGFLKSSQLYHTALEKNIH